MGVDEVLSLTLTWPPILFLSFLSQLPSWPGIAAASAVVALLAGISWGIVGREPAVAAVLPSVVLTHLFYLAMTIVHVVVNWPGLWGMVTLDALLAIAQLALFAFAIWRAGRFRLATLLVSWFGLAYAAPFALYAYMNTFYIGL